MASDQARDLAGEIRHQPADAIEKLERSLNEQPVSDLRNGEDAGEVDSCVGARITPRPSLNCGAIALPLPEETEDLAFSPPEMQLAAAL